MIPDKLPLRRNGWMPNNPRLPVLIYHDVLKDAQDPLVDAMEELLDRNGWPAQWRGGIFRYHHYHSNAHEALGVVAGSAQVMLGGEGGPVVTLKPRDIIVLPAGTGHCLVRAEDDFLLVGAYPEGQDWDICREAADDATLERIRNVAVPEKDPVNGTEPGLASLWQSGGAE